MDFKERKKMRKFTFQWEQRNKREKKNHSHVNDMHTPWRLSKCSH